MSIPFSGKATPGSCGVRAELVEVLKLDLVGPDNVHAFAHEVLPPKWYSFQIAYILMNLRCVLDPTHLNRNTVDLLCFPTGSGKTEAYLGLAAFTMILRRMRHPGISTLSKVCVLTLTSVKEKVMFYCQKGTVLENEADLMFVSVSLNRFNLTPLRRLSPRLYIVYEQ